MTDAIGTKAVPVLGVAAVVLMALGVVVAVAVSRTSPLERALDHLADDDDFSRASTAAAAVLQASIRIEDAATGCDEGPRCDDLNTAVATTRVGASVLLRCGRPEVVAFRRDLTHYLEALRDGDSIDPPPTPDC